MTDRSPAMSRVLAALLVLSAWTSSEAGELIFANGSRIAGELSNEALMVSTGSGLVEVAPDEVVTLSREEIRLRDGRAIRGTLVGGQLKARTSLGEITVKVDELQSYQSGIQASQPASGGAGPAASKPAPAVGPQPSAASPPAGSAAANGTRSDTGIVGGLPTMAAYGESQQGRQGSATATDSVQDAALTTESRSVLQGRTYEVVGESVLVPGCAPQLIAGRPRREWTAGELRGLDRSPPEDPEPAGVRRRPLGQDPPARWRRGLGAG